MGICALILLMIILLSLWFCLRASKDKEREDVSPTCREVAALAGTALALMGIAYLSSRSRDSEEYEAAPPAAHEMQGRNLRHRSATPMDILSMRFAKCPHGTCRFFQEVTANIFMMMTFSWSG